jgi:hypothetical protein
MAIKKGQSKTEVSKKDWSPEMMKTVVAFLRNDKLEWAVWFKKTNCSWTTVSKQDYDKNWAAVFVLIDLHVTDCFASRDQFLDYLKEMMTRHVPPFGAHDKARFEQARVAYIKQLIAYYDV